ncbi:MAG TPA: hypothetical protein IAB67_05530 [Candidatus Ventrousia excrementavium]|uniref:Uncharacterized protein n=1 Tax=Candidatus Ventrousia excrementavium TaxID=2840961 RepID=A0A9D1IUT0_9CLOT|nr:hypothetical protein [Candidatus Ventrousia excrementavium]
MKRFKEWPAALQRRWALLISAGVGILLVGLAVFFAFNDTMMLAFSSLLTLFLVLRCIHFYRTVHSGGYEVVDGVCISAGRAGIRKYRRIRLLLSDGTEKDILIDKHTSLRVGNSYRIYLRCSASSSTLSDLPGEYWTGDGFLCLENLGRSAAD